MLMIKQTVDDSFTVTVMVDGKPMVATINVVAVVAGTVSIGIHAPLEMQVARTAQHPDPAKTTLLGSKLAKLHLDHGGVTTKYNKNRVGITVYVNTHSIDIVVHGRRSCSWHMKEGFKYHRSMSGLTYDKIITFLGDLK
jgi:hypothetical protein